MNRGNFIRFSTLLVVNVVSLCVLSFYQTGTAAPQPGNQPFANAVEQRFEMITQLREISALLKEQNALLRSGRLQVVVTSDKTR